MDDRHVVLFESTTPRGAWIVDASINAEGGVSICSGDGSVEWYAVIDRAALPALRTPLQKRVKREEQNVFRFLVRAFGGRSRGPVDEIRRFLDKHAIPWRSDSGEHTGAVGSAVHISRSAFNGR